MPPVGRAKHFRRDQALTPLIPDGTDVDEGKHHIEYSLANRVW